MWLSADPFNKHLHNPIEINGSHPTLGMILQPSPLQQCPQLIDMLKSTPGNKIPCWRCTLKQAILLTFNNEPIRDEHDLVQAITNARKTGQLTALCEFSTINYHALHPTEGSLMLSYDQLNVIAKHLHDAYPKHNQDATFSPAPEPAPNIDNNDNKDLNNGAIL